LDERFTRATDQLSAESEDGKPNLEVRMGGIYVLEQIMHESVSRNTGEYYWPVLNMLTAYLRDELPATTERKASRSPGDEDILAVLGVLMRHPHEFADELRQTGSPQRSLNMNGTYLRDANLIDAPLRNTFFNGADLSGSFLRNSDLENARFNNAILVQTELGGANLKGAILRCANLTGAILRNADLRNTDLRGANLDEADLTGTDLRGALIEKVVGLTDAQLQSAITDVELEQMSVDPRPPVEWSIDSCNSGV
jgi:hypothetical protein